MNDNPPICAETQFRANRTRDYTPLDGPQRSFVSLEDAQANPPKRYFIRRARMGATLQRIRSRFA